VKNNYLDILKEFNVKNKIIKSKKMEYFLNELFINNTDIENTPKGLKRDLQILRLSIIAEMDASNLYEMFALLTDSQELKKVLLDISAEEKAHVGEFSKLLNKFDPNFKKNFKEGEKEVDEIIKNINKKG